MSGGQDETIAFLADPRSHGGMPVRRIDTHGAVVFLVGERVYKLKRAVRFSYLDYSTLERRRAACEAELRINRRAAPGIYRGVEAVVRRGGGLALGDSGGGEVVDWVVVMNRFDDASQFDRLAAAGQLTLDLCRALAEVVARFHAAAETSEAYGGAARIEAVIEENRLEMARHPAILEPARVAAADASCRRAFVRCAAVLEARRRSGHVRRCHGDLHLANICLFEGRPTLFDAIEFSDDFATIDTLFDLAFLLMDLELFVSRAHANAVFNAYLELAPEEEGLAALPLLLALRAGIRAHTDAAAASVQAEPGRRARSTARARAHLAAIEAFLAPPVARMIAIGGLSGSGKSTLARDLAPLLDVAPGAVVLRSDVIRKRRAGVAPTTRLEASRYTEEESHAVYAEMMARAARLLAVGRSVILDAVFLRESERVAAASVAAQAGVAFEGVWLEVPREEALRRIAARRDDASDADARVLELQLAQGGAPRDWRRVESRGDRTQMLERVRVIISRP